ncbi:dienelactone hydrolase family protein [soil metagenome]
MLCLRSLLAAIVALLTMGGPCLAGAITDIPADGDHKSLPIYLARPPGTGPFPAVVVLHGCGGFNGVVASWTDRLAYWGYVAVAVDSLTTRGHRTGCAGGSYDQLYDAYRALNFLASQPFVRTDRIGLLGISLGAGATLTAFEKGGIEQRFARKFRAAVAFYPPCAGSSGIMLGPTLVLIGEQDDWTPAVDCRDMIAGLSGIGISRQPADRSMVELVVYPDTHHSFLAVADRAGTRFMGHWLQYNESATEDASDRVRAFFRRTLGD